MSNKFIDAVKNDRSVTNPADRFILFLLADATNSTTKRCDPSIETLMKWSGFSDRGIQKAILRLIQSGKITKASSTGRGHSNTYRLCYLNDQRVNVIHPLDINKPAERVNVVPIKGERGSLKGERGSPQPEEPEKNQEGAAASPASLSGVTTSEGKTAPVASPARKARAPKPKPETAPPTFEQFAAYAAESQIAESDARDLFALWQAGRWHDGRGKKIAPWRQKLISYSVNGYLPSQKRARNNHNGQPEPKPDWREAAMQAARESIS